MAASGVTPDTNANGYACMKVRDQNGVIKSERSFVIMNFSSLKMLLITDFFSSQQKEELSDRERWQHLADLADFALAMKVTLMNINYQSFNNFMLRIGKWQTL